jgi:hypothetical protein
MMFPIHCVNRTAYRRRRETLQHERAQRAFAAAYLLQRRAFGLTSVSSAALFAGATLTAVSHARVILQSKDTHLEVEVLNGRVPPSRAARDVRARLTTPSCVVTTPIRNAMIQEAQQ